MSTFSQPSPVKRFHLWFGLLGGAFAWLLHLMLAYAFAEFGCLSTMGQITFWNISLVAWNILIVSVVLTLIGAAATWIPYRIDRDLRASTEDHPQAFTARVGWISSGIFTFVIVFESVPIFYFLRC